MKNKRNVNAKWFVLKVLWLGAGAHNGPNYSQTR